MAAKIGSLLASIGLDTAKFEKGAKKGIRAINNFKKRFQKDMRIMSKAATALQNRLGRLIGMVVTLAGPAALLMLVRSSLKVQDQMAKLSDSFGIGMQDLAGFTLAAERGGATAEQLKKSFEKMATNVADAAEGVGTADAALLKLGIRGKELAKLPMAEQFKLLADKIRLVKNETVKVGIVYDIFGRQGTNMLKTLELGSAGLENFVQRAKDLHISLNRIDAAQIEEANDTILEAKKTMAGFGNLIALKISPLITGFGNMYIDAAVEAKNFETVVDNAFVHVISGAAFVVDAVEGVTIAWATAKHAVKQGVGHILLLIAEAKAKLADLDPTDIVFSDKSAKEAMDHVALYAKQVQKSKIELNNLILAAGKGGEKFKELIAEMAAFAAANAEESAAARERLKHNLEEVELLADRAALAFSNAFQGFFDGFDTGMDKMLSTFKKNLEKMAGELLASQLLEIFPSLATGKGVGGFIGKLFGVGFAKGGSFEVGGKGGTDNVPVGFMATRGETVTVTPAGQTGGSKGQGGIVNNNTYDFRGSTLNETEVRAMIEQSQKISERNIQNKMARGRF